MLAHLSLGEVGILAAVFLAGFLFGVLAKGLNIVSIKMRDPGK